MDYCDVFISCLDSFWRHPFTAEHPLVSTVMDATFLQIYSHKETNWMEHIFILGFRLRVQALFTWTPCPNSTHHIWDWMTHDHSYYNQQITTTDRMIWIQLLMKTEKINQNHEFSLTEGLGLFRNQICSYDDITNLKSVYAAVNDFCIEPRYKHNDRFSIILHTQINIVTNNKEIINNNYSGFNMR